MTYNSGGIAAVSVVVTDVNADGKPDLVLANSYGADATAAGGTVAVLLGNGDDTSQSAVTYRSGGNFSITPRYLEQAGAQKGTSILSSLREATILPPTSYRLKSRACWR